MGRAESGCSSLFRISDFCEGFSTTAFSDGSVSSSGSVSIPIGIEPENKIKRKKKEENLLVRNYRRKSNHLDWQCVMLIIHNLRADLPSFLPYAFLHPSHLQLIEQPTPPFKRKPPFVIHIITEIRGKCDIIREKT